MRGAGLVSIVTVASMGFLFGACGSFGSDEPKATPDAGSGDGGTDAHVNAEAATPDGGPASFIDDFTSCADHTDALFCDDFDNGNYAGGWSRVPASPLTILVSNPPSPNHGQALRLQASDLATSPGDETGVFSTNISDNLVDQSTSLRLDFHFLVHALDEFAFARLGGFFFADGDSHVTHSVQLYGNDGLSIDGEEVAPTFDPMLRPALDTWHHARVVLTQTSNEPRLYRRDVFLDGTLVFSREDNNITDGSLRAGFGLYETSVTKANGGGGAKNLEVWFDDVLITATKSD